MLPLLAAAIAIGGALAQTCSDSGVCPTFHSHYMESLLTVPLTDHVCFCRASSKQYRTVHADR